MSVQHYENFPVASWLCPAALRPAIMALYWYARTADDLADEGPATPGERLATLAVYRADLSAVLARQPDSGTWRHVFEPLRHVMAEHRLPASLLGDLLSAFEQDVVCHRYDSRAQLLDYCRRSANPVGRLVLHLHGIDDPLALSRSDAICTALQLINFWQDLSVDLPRGRIYLPREDCMRHGVAAADLLARRDAPAVRRLVADVCDWAEALMHEGAPLARQVSGRTGWELRFVVQGGLRILQRLRRTGFDALLHRPTLGPRDAPRMVWQALRM